MIALPRGCVNLEGELLHIFVGTRLGARPPWLVWTELRSWAIPDAWATTTLIKLHQHAPRGESATKLRNRQDATASQSCAVRAAQSSWLYQYVPTWAVNSAVPLAVTEEHRDAIEGPRDDEETVRAVSPAVAPPHSP